MEEKSILLKIELDATSLTEGAKKAEENLKKLVPELEKIGKESGKNTLEYKKLNAEVKANQKTLTDNATALQKYESLQKQNNGSLKEMRSLLSAAKVAYAELTKEERENSEIGGKLVKDMNDLNEQLLQSEKEYGTHTRNVGNYAGALTDLKAEIKSLKGEMAGLDVGSERYQELSKRAGDLKDKMDDVNTSVKTMSGDTSFEKMSSNMQLLKDDLTNLDFKDVAMRMKEMASISKSMTFKEVLGGLKNMGSAFVSLGKTILLNPLFLMVGVIAGVGYALKVFSDSVKEDAIRAQENYTASIRENINALKQQAEYSKDYSDLFIRRAELEGKSVKEIGKMKLDAFKDEHKRKLQLDKELFKQEGDLQRRWMKEDDSERADKLKQELDDVKKQREELNHYKHTADLQYQNLKLEVNNAIEADEKAHNERLKSQNETAYNERLALARKIRDLQLGNLELSHQNERKAVEAQYKFLEDSAQGNIDELLRIEADKNKALNDLDKQEETDRINAITERSNREIEDAKRKGESTKEIETRTQLELDAVSLEFTTRKKERDNEHTNKVLENNKLKAKSEQETADKIELIDAELALAKAKGTKDEFSAWAGLRFTKIRQIEAEAQREIQLTKATGKEKERIEKEAQLKIQQLQNETFENSKNNAKKETELTKEEKKNLAINIINSATQLADSLMQIGRNQIQTELNEEKDKFDAQTQLLNDQLAQGIISQANFNAQKSVLDAEYAQKEKELKLKQFQSNKASQLINATIATAVGVANALASPPPLGLIMAGIAGALGAAQIAIIASQPTPKFAKGGILNGASHANGGIPTPYGELEGGEAVINKRSTRLFTPLLSAINEAGGGVKFANGGVLQPMVNSVDSSFQMQNMIIQSLRNMPNPIVSVQEIIGVQNRVTSVVDRATF
jgi:hypothetical protein